jgi:hypothetical protein
MVHEERGPEADEGTTGEVEEADVPAQLGVARVEVVALGQHHPPPRVEAQIDNVMAVQAGGGPPPVVVHGAEADVVNQVTG